MIIYSYYYSYYWLSELLENIPLQGKLLCNVKYCLSILTPWENEKTKETGYFPSLTTKKKKSLSKQYVLFGVIKISEQR